MASQEESDLCREILKEIYGDLAEKVVGSLLNFGRLTAAQISKHTELPVPIVRRALVPLIQNRFVLYWIHPNTPKVCHYYANTTNIIHTLAIPQILTTVTAKFPEKDSRAAEIIKNLFAFGHIRASDYIEGVASQTVAQISAEETAEDSEYQVDRARSEISKVITDLVSKKFLIPLFSFDFNHQEDLRLEMYQQELKKLPRTGSETARKASATDSMEKEYSSLILKRDSENAGLITQEALREQLANENGKGNDGKPNGAANAARRVRRNVAHAQPKLVVDPNTVLSVNYDKFMVIFRNDELAGIAARNIGRVSAYIYRHLLRCYEAKILRCTQKVPNETGFYITTMSIINSLDPTTDIRSSIVAPSSDPNHSIGVKRPADEDIDDDPYLNATKRPKTENESPFITDDGADDDNDLSNLLDDSQTNGNGLGINGNGNGHRINAMDVNRHLELIAASPLKLLVKLGNRGGGEWYVPFDSLRDIMRRLRYDEIIEHKFGTEALRILRIVREKGMGNDELLSRTALLRADTIHKHCLQLHTFGALEMQEVPRSADRAPSKTLFMWFHRPQRAYALAEEYLNKTLTRLLKRVRAERKEHPVLLAKLRREDVRQNENLYLTPQEKQEISQLRSKEEKLLVQVNRVQSLLRVYSEY